MPKVRLSDLEKDERVYYRPEMDRDNVRTLSQKLENGVELDSILGQRVEEDGEEKIIVVDGWHRKEAYELYNTQNDDKFEEVEVEFWREETLEIEEFLDEMLIQAFEINDKQGVHNREIDTKGAARKLQKRNPSWGPTEIGERLNRSKSTISPYVKDIRQKQKASRHSKIIRLLRLGWSRKDIASLVDLTPQRISQIENSFEPEHIFRLFEKGKDIEAICETQDVDECTAWGIYLEEKDDLEKFEEFGKSDYKNESPRSSNEWIFKWKFPRADPRLGVEENMSGSIPGQIAQNVLYYFTDPGDLVVDPLSGTGITVDACLVMNRRCLAYDINPRRYDIRRNDIRERIPDEAHGCDLLFLDPYYYNITGDYYDNLEEFYRFINTIAEKSYEAISDDGLVTLLMCDFTKGQFSGKEEGYVPLISQSYEIFRSVGFYPYHRISVPIIYWAEKFQTADARKKKKLLGKDRVLWVFTKQKDRYWDEKVKIEANFDPESVEGDING